MNSIQETITRLFVATDQQDWETVRLCFDETVMLDYSSMNGVPATALSSEQIISSWRDFLPGFDQTHHQVGNFIIEAGAEKASAFCYGTATHFIENEDIWTVVGSYEFELIKTQSAWKISAMKFKLKYQSGDTSLPEKAIKQLTTKKTNMKKIEFTSEGLSLRGNLYYPENYQEGQTYPAIVVSGSWTTVKEQMAGLYASKLAKNGFITLAFDFRNFGESEGEPRFYESPLLKKEDIKHAISYLESLREVDPNRIGAFGVCAGAMYTLMAASEDKRIKSVVSAASWLHDKEAVKLFYGGAEGVQEKIAAAQQAKTHYAENGVVDYIPTISTEDASAAMYGPYDYYLNPERGAIKEWSADKFALMSWEDWLTTDPMTSAKNLRCPTLMIHSDGAVLPQYTRKYFSKIATEDKELYWMETELESPFHQFNYYDQEAEVNEAVEQSVSWFSKKL